MTQTASEKCLRFVLVAVDFEIGTLWACSFVQSQFCEMIRLI